MLVVAFMVLIDLEQITVNAVQCSVLFTALVTLLAISQRLM